MKIIFLLAVFIAFNAMADNHLKKSTVEVGIVEVDPVGNYLHTQTELKNIKSVMFFFEMNGQKRRIFTKLDKKDLLQVATNENIINGEGDFYTYKFNFKKFLKIKSQLFAAVINADEIKFIHDNTLLAKTKKSIIKVKGCYSNEGFHAIRFLHGRPDKDLYFYLNLDIDGDCKDDDFLR